jgi:hypothetical protein
MIPANVAAKAVNVGPRNKMIEEHLVAIASPSTGGRNPRRHDNRPPSATFRYSLTKHRLIQKEYPRNNNDTGNSSSSNQRQNNQNRSSHRNNEGRDTRHGNQNRYNDRADNRRRYDGEDSNGGYRNQGRQPPDQVDAPPRARRKYDDTKKR